MPKETFEEKANRQKKFKETTRDNAFTEIEKFNAANATAHDFLSLFNRTITRLVGKYDHPQKLANKFLSQIKNETNRKTLQKISDTHFLQIQYKRTQDINKEAPSFNTFKKNTNDIVNRNPDLIRCFQQLTQYYIENVINKHLSYIHINELIFSLIITTINVIKDDTKQQNFTIVLRFFEAYQQLGSLQRVNATTLTALLQAYCLFERLSEAKTPDATKKEEIYKHLSPLVSNTELSLDARIELVLKSIELAKTMCPMKACIRKNEDLLNEAIDPQATDTHFAANIINADPQHRTLSMSRLYNLIGEIAQQKGENTRLEHLTKINKKNLSAEQHRPMINNIQRKAKNRHCKHPITLLLGEKKQEPILPGLLYLLQKLQARPKLLEKQGLSAIVNILQTDQLSDQAKIVAIQTVAKERLAFYHLAPVAAFFCCHQSKKIKAIYTQLAESSITEASTQIMNTFPLNKEYEPLSPS